MIDSTRLRLGGSMPSSRGVTLVKAKRPIRANVTFAQLKVRPWPFIEYYCKPSTNPDHQKEIAVLNLELDLVSFDYWKFVDNDCPEYGWIIKIPHNPVDRSRFRSEMTNYYLTFPDKFFDHLRSLGAKLIEVDHANTTVIDEPLPPTKHRIYLGTLVGHGKSLTLRIVGLSKANPTRVKQLEQQHGL